MGQEERKNKAKLEKTQISVATSNTDYENAVKALEDTTARWNREWKAAADKFQDLEEERLDFTKSSLWQFANIASTVCVSDDASCEKIRLSLEKLDVETDIVGFIKESGTGQEIPDPPKYLNFCRGDVADSQSEASEDDNYSVAQFPRNINPAFRSSSPQPSTYESHHDPNSILAQDLGHREDRATPRGGLQTANGQRQAQVESYQKQSRPPPDMTSHGPIATIPHDPYPMDGMTMLCRTGPPSERSSHPASARPSSRDSHSDYSNPTSMSSQEPPSGSVSPTKQEPTGDGQAADSKLLKKKSGFFQNHSPFRRKSTKDAQTAVAGRGTWHASADDQGGSPARRPQGSPQDSHSVVTRKHGNSPEPIDANASLALNVGQNVFNVSAPELERRAGAPARQLNDETDPIALALAELKGVGSDKQSAGRVSADRYHGIATPAPNTQQQFSRSVPPSLGSGAAAGGVRETPPPSYDHQMQRLGVPPQAVTAKAMKETSQKFAAQTRTMLGAGTQPGSGGLGGQPSGRSTTRGADLPRAASPAPRRSTSPQQAVGDGMRGSRRSASPNPMSAGQRWPAGASAGRSSDQGYYRRNSPNTAARSASPAPHHEYARSHSAHAQSDMAVQLAPPGDDGYGSQPGRSGGRPGTSCGNKAMGLYDGGDLPMHGGSRQRSKSVADPSRQYTSDGRPILHFGKSHFESIATEVGIVMLTCVSNEPKPKQCTYTKLPFPRSSASLRGTCSPCSGTRTMAGGKLKCTGPTGESA